MLIIFGQSNKMDILCEVVANHPNDNVTEWIRRMCYEIHGKFFPYLAWCWQCFSKPFFFCVWFLLCWHVEQCLTKSFTLLYKHGHEKETDSHSTACLTRWWHLLNTMVACSCVLWFMRFGTNNLSLNYSKPFEKLYQLFSPFFWSFSITNILPSLLWV